MAKNSTPSRNPSDSTGDMPGAIREVLGKFLQGIDDQLPAKIIAYDRATNRATVKPLIAVLTTNGDTVSRHQLASVPVFNIGGGNAILSFNLVLGDLGWIKATDRDIADFLKNYSESAPATQRIHDFSNALFFPDVMTGYTIDSEDEGNAVLQTLDGIVRVSLFPDKLKITAPLIETDGPVEIEGYQKISGNAEVGGNLTVTGGASLGSGGAAIARVGDQVQIGAGIGTIISGSANHTAS